MNYFRGDYVWLQVMKSFVCGTIAFGVVFGMYIFYDFEVFMLDIYKMDFDGIRQIRFDENIYL